MSNATSFRIVPIQPYAIIISAISWNINGNTVVANKLNMTEHEQSKHPKKKQRKLQTESQHYKLTFFSYCSKLSFAPFVQQVRFQTK
mmetsp:Transcript_58128/g.86411  ORF Transcript_58128/g.86411 Transcript_58128/m.86411 type:complete len:87 (+) Transcript_58128:130-390(+)